MDRKKVVYVSSSIENFRQPLWEATHFDPWVGPNEEPCVFFGLYGPTDYKRFLEHKGPKKVFWCGSDILHLEQANKTIWRMRLKRAKAEHFCENEAEQLRLGIMGIHAQILPLAFFNIDKIKVSYKQKKKPHVYLNVHYGREDEYGLGYIIPAARVCPDVTFHVYGNSSKHTTDHNVVWHGRVENDVYEKETKKMQAGLRLNAFDGFGEVIAKSVLMGQYPISRIRYKHIDNAVRFEDLIYLLEGLSLKDKPNTKAETYWRKVLTNNLKTLLG